MAELAVREALALVKKVIIVLCQKFKRPTILHDYVEKAQIFLEKMQAYLKDSEHWVDQDRQLNELIQQFVGVPFRIEDALDKFLVQLVREDNGIPSNISQQTDAEVADFIGSWEASITFSIDIDDVVGDCTGLLEWLVSQSNIPEGSSSSRLGDTTTFSYDDLATGDQVVGFEELKDKLMMQLAEEDPKLSTVLIVGPGGSGKSTLVKNVFESDHVQGLFDFKRWIPVPRGPFQLNELLLEYMLYDCENRTSASEEKIDPKAKLRQFLRERKYLVVLDDVWRKEDLQCIMKVLPNDFQGSRIIVTTRNSDVASSLSPKYSHDLSSGLSWEKAKVLLFKKKAFRRSKGNCPVELESENILRWCGCLPYAISEVGTLLAMKTRTAKEWRGFQKKFRFRSAIRPDSTLSNISRILQPSYVDLPNHLKTCFLYLSAFPVDYCIEAEMLVPLWVAEGFVNPKRGMTEEEVAEQYLNELIARSLVLATEREINGKVRTCRVVTHVRDFILSKPENFITVFDHNSSTDGTPGEQIRRLSIHQADHSLFRRLIARDELKHIRTLLLFTESECLNEHLDKLVKATKYLRVLDLSGVEHNFQDVHFRYLLYYFMSTADDPILLKYINLRGYRTQYVPKFIRKFQFLETLNLQSTEVIRLPKEIHELSSLRHLLVSNSSRIGVKFTVPNKGVLSSIESLSLIDVENDKKIIKGMGELRELRKLELVDLGKKDGKVLCISLEKMKHLSTLDVTAKDGELLDLDHISSPPLYLQHLRLDGRLQRLPKWISKLTSLQKVELHCSDLHSNPTELLDKLPNLIELHLENYYRGEELAFGADTFKRLMKLSIAGFHELNWMEVADGALPMLRELNMSNCSNQLSLPNGIGGLKSLNKLVLADMRDEFVAMLRKGSEHRQMVRHIAVILCTRSGKLIEDLSERVSSTSNIRDVTEKVPLDDISESSVVSGGKSNKGHDGKQGEKTWYSKVLPSKFYAKMKNRGQKKGSEKEEEKGKSVIV